MKREKNKCEESILPKTNIVEERARIMSQIKIRSLPSRRLKQV